MISHRTTIRALLALACAALCAALLAACGESDDASGAAASSTLERTFDATSKIDSGRLDARFALEPDGLLALGGPITLRASGPFATTAAGGLPRFDMRIATAIAGQAIDARARSTGKAGYLRLDGRDYKIDDRLIAMLRDVLGDAKGGGFASLGLDPRAWITKPELRGNATVGGVDTLHITGAIAVERLLADVARLLDGAGGSGGSGGFGGLLTPKLRKQIAAAVRSSKVELWTGAQDSIVRQLVVFVDFAFEKGQSPITGLDGGRINLRLNLDGVDATTVEVRAPKRARPLSGLIGKGGLGALLGGVGGALGGGPGTGDGGAAFLKCLDSAGERAADVGRCASKLAP